MTKGIRWVFYVKSIIKWWYNYLLLVKLFFPPIVKLTVYESNCTVFIAAGLLKIRVWEERCGIANPFDISGGMHE